MKDVVKCPECGRITPRRHPKCVYCAAVFRRSAEGVDPLYEPRMLGAEKKRFTRQSDDRGHYLIIASGKPVEVDPGKLFVIGRDPRTSLVIHTHDVSRQHAEISWEGDPPQPQLNEVRSRNGTYLNDQLVRAGEPQPMRSGDEIRLGSQVTMTYLYVTDRELRVELEERAKSDTRRLSAAAVSEPAPAGEDLGELVAAALGEADLQPLEAAGDFSHVPGKELVKRLYNECKSGVLTVYDGTSTGELVLVEGRCQHAVMGTRQGKQALRQIATLGRGLYRFRPEDPDVLMEAPPPAEVDANGLALSGDYRGSVLVRDLVARKETGVLTVFSGRSQSGCLVLEHGICQTVQLGSLRDREALDALVRLDRGVYRFRPAEPGTLSVSGPGAPDPTYDDYPEVGGAYGGSDGYGYPEGDYAGEVYEDDGYEAAGYEAAGYDDYEGGYEGYDGFQGPPTGVSKRHALRPPNDDDAVRRRSSTPVRPSDPEGPQGGRTRRERPPPPPRRRKPPPPRPR